MTKIAAVFGSSRTLDPLYDHAYQVGRVLAQYGYTVMTGGYGGVMEAASKGAKDAGGQTIGVTVAAFDEGRDGPNPYVDEVIQFESLGPRLLHLCTHADAAIAVEGGVGTLAEVAVTWNLIQSNVIDPIPFILLGPKWEAILRAVYGDGAYHRPSDLTLFRTADTPEDVIALIENWST